MSYFEDSWGPYVSVAEKRRQAQREISELKKKGRPIAPVTIEGRTIARNFWGKAWCSNLERYSDFASRLPRGRSYVRNGCVVDLQITAGKIAAKVSGQELYDVAIAIAPVAAKRWRAVCRDCSGTIDSLVELLQGRLAKSVMDRVCREGDGLFPAPAEIKLSCSCPDWADMCKHVAATLYGVGARLDDAPRLLFVLRGVDEGELLAGTGQEMTHSKSAPDASAVLNDGDVAALFGIEMADVTGPEVSGSAASKQKRDPNPKRRIKHTKGAKIAAATKTPASRNDKVASARSVNARGGQKHSIGRRTRSSRRSPI
ncbi:SWIM zinc finger family protein [Bradyrhizobium sp. CCGUVB23]|uniref:SWIM zinc finger family protein n=1 Tax=Bradyrhizobium sp. CCGUVB23 TaxID=2949630 RepID=UPI0020B2370A|nr:SWIM zinc finger family protein [Bradyrhizobium sp. CCGUVB23]MCP3463592.1 SWIM zinc finger family protein [Bradyrhizobium sp. CCGUVB23]